MSNTTHHGKNNHQGHDYGKRFRCNVGYNQSYGKFGRKRMHEELRTDDKKLVKSGVNYYFSDQQ